MHDTDGHLTRMTGAWPLLGHVVPLLCQPRRFLRSMRQVGDLVRVDLARFSVYMLTDPALIHQALTNHARHLDKGRIFERARPVFGDGLVTASHELHRTQRRLIQPAFHRARIRAYAVVIERRARALAESWRPGQRVALDLAMYDLTVSTLTETMFSAQADRTTITQIQQSLSVVSRFAPLMALLPGAVGRLPLPLVRDFNGAARQLRAVIDAIVGQRRAAGGDHDDLLAMLLAARDDDTGEAMTEAQLRDELVTMLAGGTETVATALAWTFHCLGQNPDVYQRVQAEVDAVTTDGPPGVDALPRLAYTTRVLTEVLRLYAPLIVMRRATSAITLGEHRLPAGAEMAFSPYTLHRDPGLYRDPDRLDPDRWLPEPAGRLPRGAFIPFGEGPRQCIGNTFAMTEMLIAIATILARWRLEPAPGHAVREVLAAFPRPSSVPVTIQPRPS